MLNIRNQWRRQVPSWKEGCWGQCSYPYLKFDSLVLPEDSLDFEIDANRWNEGRREGIIGVTEQERCFANAAVADDQQFEHVVEILISCIFLPPVVLAHWHSVCIKQIRYLNICVRILLINSGFCPLIPVFDLIASIY